MANRQTFITVFELAEILNEKIGTIRTWIAKKRIPYFKRGKRILFDLDEINAWDKGNHHPCQ